MKRIVLLFPVPDFKEILLYKDVGLLLSYLEKEYSVTSEIIYSKLQEDKIPKDFRGIKLIEVEYKFPKFNLDKFKIIKAIDYYKYLLKNAKNIDCLFFFHYSIDKVFFIQLYKFLNPKGKIYIKLDSDGNYREKGMKALISKFILKKCEKKVDLFSIETTDALKKTRNKNPFGIKDFEKLIYIPNGFDEDYLIENKISVKSFKEKENIMMTIGRLGTEQKNNELLLETLEKIDLQDWKVLLIGPYTEEFKKLYNKFIEKNQEKKDKVLLVGNISNRELLYSYYNRIKVFILTSKWESFGIVLVEALRFGNYIITTDVGGARDITKNGKLGSIIEVGNNNQLKNEIEKVIYNKINLKEKYEVSLNFAKNNFLWNNIIRNEALKKSLKIDLKNIK